MKLLKMKQSKKCQELKKYNPQTLLTNWLKVRNHDGKEKLAMTWRRQGSEAKLVISKTEVDK